MSEEIKENTITLGFKKLPIGMFTKYQKARLNGFDITDKLSHVNILLEEPDVAYLGESKQNKYTTRAVLTFKDGFIVVCQKVYIVELGKEEV